LDRQRQEAEEIDAEEIAQRLKQRYGRSAALGGYRGDLEHVPQSLLIPSVNDPKIWMVKCKPGSERGVVFNMCRKFMNMETTKKPLQILSCFTRDSLKGYIYLEAERQAHVTEAIERMNNVYGSKLHLVPVGEMVDCLRVKAKELEIKIQMWVRVRRGKYGGDLGQVVDITDTGESATIKLIPRLDVTLNSFGSNQKRKKGDIRPPQKLFNPNEVK
jgi:transcription elongation factor SPT5